jgi:hypothetical protein
VDEGDIEPSMDINTTGGESAPQALRQTLSQRVRAEVVDKQHGCGTLSPAWASTPWVSSRQVEHGTSTSGTGEGDVEPSAGIDARGGESAPQVLRCTLSQ